LKKNAPSPPVLPREGATSELGATSQLGSHKSTASELEMLRGRKPTPTHLRILQGNPQHRRLPRNEAQPDISDELPAAPSFLHAYAVEEWDRVASELHHLRVLTRVDRGIFAAYCQSYARWRLAEEALARMTVNDGVMNGFIIRRRNGEAGPNPLVGAARRAAHEMLRFAGEFGMTPVARARIAMGLGSEDDRRRSKFGDLLA